MIECYPVAMQIDYVLGDSGRSWLAGFGTNYPTLYWHKMSYNSYIDWPTRNITIFANWTAQQTDNTFKTLLYGPLAKFDMEGEWQAMGGHTLRSVLFGGISQVCVVNENAIKGLCG